VSRGQNASKTGTASLQEMSRERVHKTRIFISEVFRFEELGFELMTLGFYRVFFRDLEIGELNAEELRFRAARRVV
jgi:hypothetical protein